MAFAFRKATDELWQRRLFGAAFAFSSVVTPFFLGTVAGAIASRRVPPGIAAGDVLTSWWNPTSLISGALAVGLTAYLAAVYLTADARREGRRELAEFFRRRALLSGVLVGALAAAALLVIRVDAEPLYAGLTSTGLPLVSTSVAAGVASLVLLVFRAFLLVRLTAALAVTAVIWGWGAAQYPVLLPGLSAEQAAGDPEVLRASLWALGVGGLVLVPSLLWLFAIFQSDRTIARHRS